MTTRVRSSVHFSDLSEEELERTWNLELADIITEVTGVGYQQIQRNVFQFTDADSKYSHSDLTSMSSVSTAPM